MLNFSPFARRWPGWPPSQSASGAGILRCRLYDLDRIIAAPYTLVTGLLIGVSAGPVLLATRVLSVHKPVAVAAATLASAPEVNHRRRVGAARIAMVPVTTTIRARATYRMLAAIRVCPLAATEKAPWPSQSVTGFASRRTVTLP